MPNRRARRLPSASRLHEAGATGITALLRVRRGVRTVDERHGAELHRRLARPTAALLVLTFVLALAGLTAGRVDARQRSAAAARTAVQATPKASNAAPAPGPVPSAPQPSLDPAPAPAEGQPEAAATSTPPAVAPISGGLPVGKGMWLWQPDQVEGGDVNAMVARAKATGLTHIYVRTGSSVDGFYAQAFLDQVLPAAHAAGLRVIGWDFPYLSDVGSDIERAVSAISYVTPGGHRLDGFAPDIETASEGVALTVDSAVWYGSGLRAAVGAAYPLIATVPNPTDYMVDRYPYAEVTAPFDAIAPMVYWLNREPDSDVATALDRLAPLGKPILPIGQAYDGGGEGGRPGPPTPAELARFLDSAERHGAAGVSFWSWQHATQETWDAIAAAPQFTIPAGPIATLVPAQVRSLQILLTSLGFPAGSTGKWDAATASALMRFQAATGLHATGLLDDATRATLLGPLAPSSRG
ncbi:MAG: hypothetical protein QOF97_742 [Acidimicrobiaceae bacterium]